MVLNIYFYVCGNLLVPVWAFPIPLSKMSDPISPVKKKKQDIKKLQNYPSINKQYSRLSQNSGYFQNKELSHLWYFIFFLKIVYFTFFKINLDNAPFKTFPIPTFWNPFQLYWLFCIPPHKTHLREILFNPLTWGMKISKATVMQVAQGLWWLG